MRACAGLGARSEEFGAKQFCRSSFISRIAELPDIPGVWAGWIQNMEQIQFCIILINFLIITAQKLGGSVVGLMVPSGAAFFVVALVKIC